MSLLEDIKAEQGTPGCPIAKLLEELDAPEANDLRAALADLSISGGVLTRVLQRRNHQLGNNAVNNHRKNKCSCR